MFQPSLLVFSSTFIHHFHDIWIQDKLRSLILFSFSPCQMTLHPVPASNKKAWQGFRQVLRWPCIQSPTAGIMCPKNLLGSQVTKVLTFVKRVQAITHIQHTVFKPLPMCQPTALNMG